MTSSTLLEYASGPICLDDFVSVLGQYSSARWNGWLCPSIDAYAVMEVAEAFKDDETLVLTFEGDPASGNVDDGTGTGALIVIHIDGDEWYEERLQPDEDGLYPLGAYGWTWSVDHEFYDSFEHKLWARERSSVWCAASNANNRTIPDSTPVTERFRLNHEVADAAATEWERTNHEPPKEQA